MPDRAQALRFYRQFIPQGGLCFDVGANIGDRTDLFFALGARVVAVEPQPGCAEQLRRRFGDRVELVEAALGPAAGQAELMVASYHTLSSLSPGWVEAVQASGRFAEFDWPGRLTIRVLTLDELIDRHGRPDFCKIDVEGYELEVLQGLQRPLPALSLEFTPERLDAGAAAIRRLHELGMRRFNYSAGETLQLTLTDWVDTDAILRFLPSIPTDAVSFGDVYAR